MLDKKQIWAIFKLEFKMGHGAAETTCNINNTFGPWTVKEHTVQWWFTKFYKGAFKMRSIVPSHQKLTTANWDDHWSWSSYNYMRSCWRTQHQQFYSCSECEANWKGKKKLDKWVPHELTTNQKNYFEVSYLFVCNKKESFLDCIVTCDKK